MGGPEGLNLNPHFDAEIDWTGVPIDSNYQRIQDEYAHPARQDPFSGFAYYEARKRPKRKPKRKAIMPPQGDDQASGLFKKAMRSMRTYNTLRAFAKNFNTTETQMTKDMIIGPHRKRNLGGEKRVNVGKQLEQLVDDTKVFKTQFKIKVQSKPGLRQWAQIVCRYRQTPGVATSSTDKTPIVHGKVLNPDIIGESTPFAGTYDYYWALPPVPRSAQLIESDNVYEIVKSTEGPGTENLFYLNLPLTYMEQDMYNMGMGPGKRNYTREMTAGRGQPDELWVGSQPYNVVTTNNQMEGASSTTGYLNENVGLSVDYDPLYYGIDRTRFTNMMRAVHPTPHQCQFEVKAGKQITPTSFSAEFKYNFRTGWGIHMLDYNLLGPSGTSGSNDQPIPNDPQYLRTNNSMNTIATIKNGSIAYSMNNMGESQCYVTTLVVVNKHVDEHYWSMPEALTDSYLKCAQKFLSSGEWSIVNNITDSMEDDGGVKSEGAAMNAYMYVTHPSIKPFGKVPERFLEEFNKHFAIKYYTTTKLGIGERQSVHYNLGGLQYSTDQIAMHVNQELGGANLISDYYVPIIEKDPSKKQNVTAQFPYCCQQGTTHFLFGVQGMSLPFVSGTGDDVTKVEGRWAAPALVDIQGTYKEVIAPLSTVPKKATPIQKCLTGLPQETWHSVVTTLPRVRTTDKGFLGIGF